MKALRLSFLPIVFLFRCIFALSMDLELVEPVSSVIDFPQQLLAACLSYGDFFKAKASAVAFALA